MGAFDAPRGNLDILATQGVFDIERRQAKGRQALRIEPDAHGITAFTENTDVGCTRQSLDLGLDIAADKVGDVERAHRVARKRQPDDRGGVGFDLGDHRFVDILRQTLADPRDTVSHIGSRRIGFAIEAESHRDLTLLGSRDRGQDIDTLDTGNRVLHDLGDLGLDDLGRGTQILGIDRDHRQVDLGIFAHRQPVVADRAQQHQHQGQDGREDRAANADL